MIFHFYVGLREWTQFLTPTFVSHFFVSLLNTMDTVLRNSTLCVASIFCRIAYSSDHAVPVQPRMGRKALGDKEQSFVGEVRIWHTLC